MSALNQIIDLIISLFKKNNSEISKSDSEVTSAVESPPIDWTNTDSKISKFFTVKDATWLPSWSRQATESDGLNDTIKANLIDLCKQMDEVRDFFGKPIVTHVSYRPPEYNKAIGGALHSAHSDGAAMDFHIVGLTCDEVRKQLVDNGLLDKWSMRCEDAPGTNWVHLDRRALLPDGHRFFKP